MPFPAPSRPAPEATIAETPLTPAQPEPSVQVEAVRETVRYSVPTSSIASLPPSLAARLSAQAGWSQPQLANEPAPVLAAPVAEPPMSAEIVDAAEDFLPPLDSEDDPATRSMAGKFAPSAQRN